MIIGIPKEIKEHEYRVPTLVKVGRRDFCYKNIIVFIIVSSLIFLTDYAEAGNFGIGVHSGYGVMKFEEKENYLGDNLESESKQNVILLGGSGEYSFQRFENFYTGVTTDWAFGLKDRETWKQDNVQVQTNDMKFFGQFYDLRFGYKNSLDALYYRLYISGGWDGLRFKRDRFIWQGTQLSKSSTENMSLWRTGIGAGFGHKVRDWAIDGRLAYSYYLEGKTEDSSLPNITFDTDGTCLDIGLGAAREITKNMSFYFGGSYTLQKLKGETTSQSIDWRSKLEIMVGMVNLTYAF